VIVMLTTSMQNRNGALVWFTLDIPACHDLDEVFEALRTDSVLRGERIDTAVTSGARRVTRRTPCIIALSAICLITPMTVEVLSETGEAL
jgi:hypothetical protein